MDELIIKMPDVGEGIAEAELVEWHVAVGDLVREDAVLAAVMTDKATVEIPSPSDGEVMWLGAALNEKIAVGAPLLRLKVKRDGQTAFEPRKEEPASPPVVPPLSKPAPAKPVAAQQAPTRQMFPAASVQRREGEKPVAAPSVRQRALEAGIDLRQVPGSGPAGRIMHDDLDAFLANGRHPAVAHHAPRQDTSVHEIKVVGLRRKIAEKMVQSKTRIPHITYVEEIDMTALEELRAELNRHRKPEQPKLTILPFLMRAMVKAIANQPQFNARYDDDAGVISQYGGVHIGIATQTPTGLMVPVVRHAEARDLWMCATEVNRMSDAAKTGQANREDLTGSTITISSLGALGGIMSTPVINYPEVAIIGVNKIAVRPFWDGSAFVPRKIMNLSSSFDHRIIDGWDAALFIQRIKTLLETPALIFVEG